MNIFQRLLKNINKCDIKHINVIQTLHKTKEHPVINEK